MRLFGRLRLFGFGCEAGDAGHEFVEEPRHIHADSHLHGLDRVVEAGFVADGTSAGRAFHVNLHVDVERGDERRVDGDADGERIVQAAAAEVRRGGLVGLDVEVGHVREELAGLGAKVTPLLGFLISKQGLQGHVEADHSGRGAGTEQVVGGFRILRNVGFHAGVAVARHGQCAAHEHHAADLVLDFRSLLQSGFDVGHRAGRHVNEILAVGLHRIDDEVDRGFGFDGTVGIGDVHVADAVVAVDERGDRQHFEVVGGAGVRQALVDLDFRVAEQVGHGERVAYALFHEHVAVSAGDADEFDFRAAQRVGDGERVVDAGIEIKNELLHDCAFLVDWL